MKQEMMGWQWHQLDHANNVNLTPHRQSRQHLIAQLFYKPDALPDA